VTIEESNAAILRRTLAAISGLYAFWTATLGIAAWGAVTTINPRLLLLHAGLLGLAGVLLWKPRKGAVIATLAAAAGSIFFVVFDLRRDSVEAALVDGGYPLVAALLLYKSRRRT
jgi:hypothetical protein